MQSYCLKFRLKWIFVPCPETNVWDNSLYYMVLTASSEMLLLPFDSNPLQICQYSVNTLKLSNCVQYQGFNQQSIPVKTKGMQSRVSQYTSMDYSVFIASNQASNWLTMIFVSVQSDYASAMVKNSMTVDVTYTLEQSCSLTSCIGCTQLSVQRLCYAAQQCQVARCVGSQVNQLRPLCAMGGAVEAQFVTFIAAMNGMWSMISSTLTNIIETTGGIIAPKNITWPDQAFYGVICSQKDVTASLVSILTSAVNGIVQASMPVTILDNGDTVDNRFLATFSLTMMAITEFIFQLALLPLYGAIGTQKVVICQVNSLMAAVAGNNAIVIGDSDIQSATSAATGVCMSQVFAENAQSMNNGMDNDQAFASGTTQMLSRLGGLALELPLDAIIHPIDVMFAYALGVVIGLQDVLQTVDQKK